VGFPLPTGPGTVAVDPPAPGAQNWAGAPSAALDDDGSILLAYRMRWAGPDDANVIARSADGERYETVVTLDKTPWGAAMVERPALVRLDSGRWRLYVCGATPASRHWWVGAVEAGTLEGLADAELVPVFPGDAATGVKDPVVRREPGGRWHAWLCCHPLDVPDEEDRMTTAHATSDDGLAWQWHGTVLAGRPGRWDARGARLSAVLPGGGVAYDGRATKEENWFERTGLATRDEADRIEITSEGPVLEGRYLEAVPLPDGSTRLFWEARRGDGSHELRTDLVPAGPRRDGA
jgi:hypothetical protein